MRGNSEDGISSNVGGTAGCTPGAGDCKPPQDRLEQAVGHELAKRLLAALSGPHGRRILPRP